MRPVLPDYLSFSYDYEYKEIFKCLRRECIDHKIKFLFLYRPQKKPFNFSKQYWALIVKRADFIKKKQKLPQPLIIEFYSNTKSLAILYW